MDIYARRSLSRDARTDGIAYAEDEGTRLPRQLNGCQRVGSLSALRDGHHHIVGENDWVAIAELRGILHFYGNAAQSLDELLADECRVPTRATGHDDETPGAHQSLAIVDDCRERDAVRIHVYASPHATAQALRLLEDFLQHEVGITSLFQLSERDVNLLHLRMLRFACDVHHFQIFTETQECDVTIIQINHLVGVLGNRAGIGSKEEIPVAAQSDHKRRTLTGTDDGVGMLAVQDGNGVCANHLTQCHLHRFQQVQVVAHHDVLDELHQHLRVSNAAELDATAHEVLLQRLIVLDDAVVDERQPPCLRVVGMCIRAGRLAVCCPSCVGNADAAARVFVLTMCLEVGHAPLCLIDI